MYLGLIFCSCFHAVLVVAIRSIVKTVETNNFLIYFKKSQSHPDMLIQSVRIIFKGVQIIIVDYSSDWLCFIHRHWIVSVQIRSFFWSVIIPHSDWIRRDTSYRSVFSQNVVKYGPGKTPYLDSFHAVRSNEEYWRISDLTTNQTVIFTDVFQRSYFKYLRRHSEPVQSITDVLLKSLNRLNSQEIKKSFIFKRRRSFFTFFEVNF